MKKTDSAVSLTIDTDLIEISIEGCQKWSFTNSGSGWGFAGVYTWMDSGWDTELSIENNGKYMDYAGTSLLASGYSVLDDSRVHKMIKFSGYGGNCSHSFEFIVEATEGQKWMKRVASINFDSARTAVQKEFGAGLYTIGGVTEQDSVIASYIPADESKPYADSLPGALAVVTAGSKRINLAVLHDSKSSSPEWNYCVKKNHPEWNDVFGMMTVNDAKTFNGGVWYNTTDYYYIDNDMNKKILDLAGLISDEAFSVFGFPMDIMKYPYNYRVPTYTDACKGLAAELNEPYAQYRRDGIGGCSPMANAKGAESFGTMNVLSGLWTYAHWKKDTMLIAKAHNVILNVNDGNWIQEAHNTPYYFHWIYDDGGWGDHDGYEETMDENGKVLPQYQGITPLGPWKYFDRIYRIGELAKLSGDATFKTMFMNQMPFVASLKWNGYKQPSSYNADTHEALTGNYGNGNGGAVALWACVNFLAYDLSDFSSYRDNGFSAIAELDNMDFNHMWLMRRDAPENIGMAWAAKAYVKAYELSCNDCYLDKALKMAKGALMSSYFINNDDYEFPTVGMAYASGKERWTTFLNGAQVLTLTAGLLKYRFDETLAKMYLLGRQNHLWSLPLTLAPKGLEGYDNPIPVYMPFEVTLTFPGWARRFSKAQYSSGELFREHQMFEAWARVSDPRILSVDMNTAFEQFSDVNHSFRFYNSADTRVTFRVYFSRFADGSYNIKKNGISIGIFNNTQMKNGTPFTFSACENALITTEAAAESPADTTAPPMLTGLAVSTDDWQMVTVSWTALDASDIDHYDVYRSTDLTVPVAQENWVGVTTKTAYMDTGLREGETYYYRVLAVDSSGNANTSAAVIKVITPVFKVEWMDNFDTIDGWSSNGAVITTTYNDEYVATVKHIDTISDFGHVGKSLLINLDENPYLYLRVYSLSGNAKWALKVDDGSGDINIQPDTKSTGVFGYDLKALTGWSGSKTFTLKLYIAGKGTRFTINWIKIGES